MSPTELSSDLISKDWYLIAAALTYLFCAALIRWTPENWFTNTTEKRIAHVVFSLAVPLLGTASTGLIAHLPMRALAGLIIASFLGSAAANKWLSPSLPTLSIHTPPTETKTVTVETSKPAEPSTASQRFILALAGLALVLVSCSGAQVVSDIVTGVDAACVIADVQDEPAWLKVICKGIDPQSGKPYTFTARLPREAAQKALQK